ncbi:hypothetical protein [Roseateles sp. P5_E4]
MKKRGTWLQTAVRARQAQTFDHMQRAQQARDELYQAEQLAIRSDQALISLSESWAGWRREVASSMELDSAYRRFHGFLHDKATTAGEAQQACQGRVDAVETDLQQSHAVQRTLEKVSRQAAERRWREARDKETQDAAEAWLLGRFARPLEVGHARSNGTLTAGRITPAWAAPRPALPVAAPGSPMERQVDIDGDSAKTHPQGGGSDDVDTRR